MPPRPISEDPPSPIGPVRIAVSVGVRTGIVIERGWCVNALRGGLVVVVLDDTLSNNGCRPTLDDDFGAFAHKWPVQVC